MLIDLAILACSHHEYACRARRWWYQADHQHGGVNRHHVLQTSDCKSSIDALTYALKNYSMAIVHE